MTAVLVSESCRPIVRILGVPVDATDLPRAVESIKRWGERGKARAVFLRDVHGVMRSVHMPALMQMHETADLVLADGAPLTWISRLRGVKVGRVPGTDLIDPQAKGIGDVLSFGSYTAGSAVVSQIGNGAPDMAIGRMLGLAETGIYSRSVALVGLIRRGVDAVMIAVALPGFSKLIREGSDPPADVSGSGGDGYRLDVAISRVAYRSC